MRIIKWAVAIAVVIAIAVGGYFYWEHSQRYPSTDDAYIGAHVIHPAPEVSGEVEIVNVRNAEHVNQGDLLFKLDLTPFKLAVKQAEAQLEQAREMNAGLKAAVAAARAEVANREAQLDKAKLDAKRTHKLVKKGYRTKAQGTDVQAELKSAKAALALAKAKLNQAVQQLGQKGEGNYRVVEAKAELGLRKWQLAHAAVYAPCSGEVTQVQLRPGDTVQQGRSPFVLVCDNKVWVDANYKETDIAGIHPGDKATISVDMYPNKTFHGRVIGINPAAGTAFSLLPPENATGNWVKVTQRVPVRVLITDTDPAHPLRVGTSAEVTIDIQSGPGNHKVADNR
ncbi:MAG TPA: HlyD family secretion protein [Gammaproteobacteria bacterium]|nr:HlyD family secretion protein [Gammaproteobacteria bacterium]